MVARVQLINKENSYCVLSPTNFEEGSIETYFIYSNGNKNKTLTEARRHGRSIANHLGLEFVEEL